MNQIIKLWKKYEEFWDYLVDIAQTKLGGYILGFSFSIGLGLVIDLIILEFIK